MLTTYKRFQIDSFCYRPASEIWSRSSWTESFPNPSDTQWRYNKHLTNLVFSVCTVSYGSSFFPLRYLIMARVLRAWPINRRGKTSVRNRCGSRILKWGVNFCNNVIEPINIWGIRKKRKKGAHKNRGGGVKIHPFHLPWIRACVTYATDFELG